MFLNIQIDWIILKTCNQQFTLTTKKSLHIIFKAVWWDLRLASLLTHLFSFLTLTDTGCDCGCVQRKWKRLHGRQESPRWHKHRTLFCYR